MRNGTLDAEARRRGEHNNLSFSVSPRLSGNSIFDDCPLLKTDAEARSNGESAEKPLFIVLSAHVAPRLRASASRSFHAPSRRADSPLSLLRVEKGPSVQGASR